jgi:DNA-binding transcriptional LysR family regulator
MKPGLSIDRAQFDGIVAFLAVAEHRSFRAAADELGVSPSAISQIIRRLEGRIGVALLTRTTRHVGLTEAGARLLEKARPAVEALGSAFSTVQGYSDEPTGLLRLNVPRAASASLLDPLIRNFCSVHPNIQVELHADDFLSDIVGQGFDAGIRLAARVDADMIAVRVTPPFAFGVVGAPDYFKRHELPRKPGDLASHRCIGFRSKANDAEYRWEFRAGRRPVDVKVSGPLIVNDWALSVKAATLGMGLAYAPRPLAQPHLDMGSLVSVLDGYCLKSEGAFLYYPARDQALPKLRAFVEFLRAYRQTNRNNWL